MTTNSTRLTRPPANRSTERALGNRRIWDRTRCQEFWVNDKWKSEYFLFKIGIRSIQDFTRTMVSLAPIFWQVPLNHIHFIVLGWGDEISLLNTGLLQDGKVSTISRNLWYQSDWQCDWGQLILFDEDSIMVFCNQWTTEAAPLHQQGQFSYKNLLFHDVTIIPFLAKILAKPILQEERTFSSFGNVLSSINLLDEVINLSW